MNTNEKDELFIQFVREADFRKYCDEKIKRDLPYIELQAGDTMINYLETVARESRDIPVMTPNKHNRLYIKVEPLCPVFQKQYLNKRHYIDSIINTSTTTASELQKCLVTHLGMEPFAAKQVLAFGGEEIGLNIQRPLLGSLLFIAPGGFYSQGALQRVVLFSKDGF